MSINLLDQLQHTEVPPPPTEMRRDVHDRLNQWLLIAQVAELVFQGFGYAATQFAAAVLGLTNFTLTGDYKMQRDNEEVDTPNDNSSDM